MDILHESIGKALSFKKELSIPSYIKDNLKHDLFSWQKKALQHFFFNEQSRQEKEQESYPHHLMFNMATGSGKTLLMAATLLYYYKEKGYRRFLFFVNRKNIVDKTEHNFINSTHSKYLFTEKIVIDDQIVPIKKVETFSDHPQGIEIKFVSIQKLHNDIHVEKENQTTLEDLHSKPLVMFADEAHHLNTDTEKKLQKNIFEGDKIDNKTSKEAFEKRGWEDTVIKLILGRKNKQDENKNVLLEFTATIPTTKSIVDKYKNKIIYSFGLKDFLQEGYTKEINLIASTLAKKERVLQALLFQWYRYRIALKYGIPNFKPVMLLRSKTINESKEDYENFLQWMEHLAADDFTFLQTIAHRIHEGKQPTLFEMGRSRTEQVLSFIKKEKIHYQEIVDWIKQNYQEHNVIITNSKQNKTKTEKTDEETEKLLNNLEDKNNHIRAIFTVDRLTEGWDVLNLFDIVRLYQGQNSGGTTKKIPEATIKEKQLIGRGVRYYPFVYQDALPYKRKFDKHLGHELRVLEELYYYTYDEESQYISHLKKELKKDGFINDNKVLKTFALKKSFQESEFYKKGTIWYNQLINNPNRKKKDLDSIKEEFYLTHKVQSIELSEQKVEFNKTKKDDEKMNLSSKNQKVIFKEVKDIEKHIFQKAIHIKAQQENSLYRFSRLCEELKIDTMDQLQTEKLAGFKIQLVVNQGMTYEDIENKEKLAMTLKLLNKVETAWKETIVPKIGSSTFKACKFKELFSTPKTKTIEADNINDSIAKQYTWYVLDGFVGTSEEEELVKFISETINNLEEKYEEVYLVRNEEMYKIYDFAQGRGFQPDFLLFLKTKNKETIENNHKAILHYQIFIEAKGKHIAEGDRWKEVFLEDIASKFESSKIIKEENRGYRLIGLPFFAEDSKKKFSDAYFEKLEIKADK